MSSDPIRQELTMLMKRAVFLDIAAYLLSILFLGVTLRFALGLVIGTAVLFGSLLLLRQSVRRVEDDAKRYGATSQRRYQVSYAIRLLIFAVGFGAAVVFRTEISPLAVVIPMLYPRLIYTTGALFSRTGRQSGQKRGEKKQK